MMKRFLFAVVIALFWINAIAAPDSTAVAEKPIQLKTVKAGKFTFSYGIDGKNLKGTVSVKTNGWIAIGFNPTNAMKDANIIIGTLADGKPFLSDDFGDELFSHRPDTSIGGTYDILAGDFHQDNGIATMTFTIPLDSGDPKDVKLVPGQKVKLIFSTGAGFDIKKKHKSDAKTTITL
jgi:DOMON domain